MRMFPPFLRRRGVAALLLLTLVQIAHGMFVEPRSTPVNRLLRNAEGYLNRHPNDADAYYTLGRIHYLAFHLKSGRIRGWMPERGADELPGVADLANDKTLTNWGALSDKDLARHATAALQNFNEALQHETPDKHGLTELGIASLKQEVANWAPKAKDAELPPELNHLTTRDLRQAYTRAFRAAMPQEMKLKTLPLGGLEDIIAYEAARNIERLAKDADGSLSKAEHQDVVDAKQAIAHFQKLSLGEVTPIVFSFTQVEHLEELLAPETTVDFDLRGYGFHERWPWLRPELGLLVWDPEHTGKIQSAQQLFGGYSFQIFRANGYDALAALDDNGDGVLTGAELNGISVWFDRNGDGMSTPDEVTPVQDLGIVAIAVTMGGYDGIHPTNARGVTLCDGRTLRTWDWMVQPVSNITAPLVSTGQR